MSMDDSWFDDSRSKSLSQNVQRTGAPVRLGDTKWKSQSAMRMPIYASDEDQDNHEPHIHKPKQSKSYFGEKLTSMNENTRAGTKKIKKGLLKLNPVLVLRSATNRGDKHKQSPATHHNNSSDYNNSQYLNDGRNGEAATAKRVRSAGDALHHVNHKQENRGNGVGRKPRGSATSSTSNALSSYSVLDQVRGKLNTNTAISANALNNGKAYDESSKLNRYENRSNDGETEDEDDEEYQYGETEAYTKKDTSWLKNRSVKKTLGILNPRKKHKKRLSELINKNLDKIILMANEDKDSNSGSASLSQDELFRTSMTTASKEIERNPNQPINDLQYPNNASLPDSMLEQRNVSPNTARKFGRNTPLQLKEQTHVNAQANESVSSFSPSLTPTYSTIDGKPSNIAESISGTGNLQSVDEKSVDTGSAYDSASMRSRNLDDVNSLTKFHLDDKKVKMEEHLRKLKSEWEREDELRMRKETFRLLKENTKMMKTLEERHTSSSQRSKVLQARLEALRSRTQDSINQLAFKVDAIADSIDDFEQLILGHERAIEDEGHREKSKWEETLHKKIKQQLEAKEEAYFDLIDQLQNRIKILKDANRNSSSLMDAFFHRTVALAISGAGIIISLIVAILQPIIAIFTFTKANPSSIRARNQ